MSRKEIKAAAKAQLGNGIFKNNWLMAVLSIIVFGIVGILVGLTGIGAILCTGPLAYGFAKLFLKQSRDGEAMTIGTMFDGFRDDFGGTIMLELMKAIFLALWSMLAGIPGIVKSYSYAMAEYIKADHPEYTWNQCITESRKMMNGHKWQLFVQDLSFIGWGIVGSICFGVGTLWVTAYKNAARSQFYLSLLNAPATTENAQ